VIPAAAYYAGLPTGFIGQAPFLTATLGKVVPLKAAYTPGLTLLFAGITPSDFDGSTAIVQDDEPVVYTDPGTGDYIVNLVEPAGGWQWEVSGVTNLPQQVFGYGLLNAAGNALVAVTPPLAAPITLNAVGQGIDAGSLTFRIPLGVIE